VKLVPLDPVQHLPGVDERDVGVDDRVERAVHRDEIVGSDELVELDVVHVTAAPELGSMQHHEHLVVIDVHLRDVIAFDAVADREVMEAEQVRQHGRLPGPADRQIHPGQSVRLFEQQLEITGGPPRNARAGDRVHVHPGQPFIGSYGATASGPAGVRRKLQ
jgi:hypothetical protein